MILVNQNPGNWKPLPGILVGREAQPPTLLICFELLRCHRPESECQVELLCTFSVNQAFADILLLHTDVSFLNYVQ